MKAAGLLWTGESAVVGAGRRSTCWALKGGVVAPLGHEKQDLERGEPRPAGYLAMAFSVFWTGSSPFLCAWKPCCPPQAWPSLLPLEVLLES